MGRVNCTRQRGALMLEVLITIVICIIGLWGLMQVQSRLQAADFESYQRSQALMLLDDIVSRIQLNSNSASSYVTGLSAPVGASACGADPGKTAAALQRDLYEWCMAISGAGEQSAGAARGAMVGALGCIESTTTSNEYLVTLAWQGFVPISKPPTSVKCGEGQYNVGDTCTGDLCRRTVTTVVRIGNLSS